MHPHPKIFYYLYYMITFNNLGRLGRNGNAMFQIASTIGLATKHGYEFAFPYWMNHDEKERFSGTNDIDIQKHFKNPLPIYKGEESPIHQVKWGFHDLTLPDNISINGHLQSEKYFKHCSELIRHFFTFKEETDRQTNTVAVHFRGGDYLKHKDYHPPCTREYYENAYKMFGDGFKFKLFTDDPEEAEKVIPFDYELVDEPDAIKAMELMTKCDGHIIANSTFSWWGAWLANSRRIIAPSTWFGPAAKLDSSDIYPEEWIVI